ncbi:phosphoenolpyruvate--protein phosphotransferase [Sphingomonas piscis]|uniref:phosphoenolpyruvate--protein phosphotransferase n=1 Tax=Sphingomonas piscis TaxID=2714943 RepID=A0A6G7YPB4_9SPHN|nr:phosphoenolpyruvate--protein phosphotransferase [Sphingomonas piscis]QIK78583.1 phosphoenolpyruvate--protein phosphotransferase [Sphingomonas piscis]
MTDLLLKAPLTGWVRPLAEVDDPVFAEGMMGDGLAIDPLGPELCAPADGEVIAIAPTSHSITLRLANGAELLIHVGLETVALGGRGFAVKTEVGARVSAGDPLIAIDLEAVARGAKSLLTPILLLSEGYEVRPLALNRAVRAGEPLLHLVGSGDDGGLVAASASQISGAVRLQTVVRLAHGIHARPAARIAAALKPFTAEVQIEANGRSGNARSTIALLTLGIGHGADIVISASGEDAHAAAETVKSLIDSGMGELNAAAPRPAEVVPIASGPRFPGVCAAPGLAIGPVVQLIAADADVPADGVGVAAEQARLHGAVDALRDELGKQVEGASGVAFAHRAILEDPELAVAALRHIDAGRSAPYAWRAATREMADQIRRTGDAFLIERIDDLVDVERRLIAKMTGQPEIDATAIPDTAIIIADNLLPSQFMALPADRVGGIVSAGGGPTSHVAILAASAGLPMLVAAGDGILSVPDGTMAILDATAGRFNAAPSAEQVERTRATITAESAIRSDQQQAAAADCIMADGTRIEVFANLGSVEDAARAVEYGAEGCGLLRTEFLFLDRPAAPTFEEQRDVYRSIAQALGGRPLIVRTLDIGGDKPVPYLDQPAEENPALGRRGVRLSLARPDLLSTQLRAILASVPANQCRIMVPMIVDVAELRAVRALLAEAQAAAGSEDHVPLGVMIETPSAAVLADSLAEEADFLSVGTNDLSQYALAVDRGNQAVAGMVDALHPAVLRLIAQAAQGAATKGKWLGICGGLASEPRAAPLLIGLGATELSAVPAAVPEVKAAVRNLTTADCRALAEQALSLGTAAEVRTLLAEKS